MGRCDAASNMASKSVHYTKTSTLAGTLEKPAVPVFLSSKVRENIFSYREKYDRYLKQTSTQHHGTFDPWGVVERYRTFHDYCTFRICVFVW